MSKTIRTYFSSFFELSIWFMALILLAFMQPDNSHLSLCPLNALGVDFCPGCGLGHSISWFFHGNIVASLRSHPLGIAAVFIISFRILKLIRNFKIDNTVTTKY